MINRLTQALLVLTVVFSPVLAVAPLPQAHPPPAEPLYLEALLNIAIICIDYLINSTYHNEASRFNRMQIDRYLNAFEVNTIYNAGV